MKPGNIRSILIIDDDAALADSLKKLLLRNSYAVHTAANGKIGLKFLAVEQVDLVITDIFMEEMEGLETILAMKRQYPDIRTIAMSGGAQIVGRDCLDMAQVLGADKILRKPVDIHTLLETIGELTYQTWE
jgi:DNA-binding NtrC family response regulator